MMESQADLPQKATQGSDKGLDMRDPVAERRAINAPPRKNASGRRSAIGGHTIRQRIRTNIEKAFGWARTVAGLRKAPRRSPAKVGMRFTRMALREAAFIDSLGPGHIRLDGDGGGEFAFGAVQGEIDGHPGQASIQLTWASSDEVSHASGEGDP